MVYMEKDNPKKRVLFMCIHNNCRSQMAEGFFNDFYGENYDVYSAGSDPREIDHKTVQVMAEIGIDISMQTSNSLKEYNGHEFDYVITICGNPYKACPFFIGGKKYFKKPFVDVTAFKGTEEEKIEFLRDIRDEIGDWVQDLFNYQICGSNTKISADQPCCDLDGDDCCIIDTRKESSCNK